jgi:hypothetical protein
LESLFNIFGKVIFGQKFKNLLAIFLLMNCVYQVCNQLSLKQLVNLPGFFEKFCAFLGKKRKNSGAISRLFDEEKQTLPEKSHRAGTSCLNSVKLTLANR